MIFWDWFKAIFVRWLGAIQLFLAIIALWSFLSEKNVGLDYWVWLILLAAAFVYSNFAGYRDAFKKCIAFRPEINIGHTSLKLAHLFESTHFIRHEFEIKLYTEVVISSQIDRSTKIRIDFESIKCGGWGKERECYINLKGKSDNTFEIDGFDSRTVGINTTVTFQTSTDNDEYNYLKRPLGITLELKFMPPKHEAIILPVEYDLSELDDAVERSLAETFRRAENDDQTMPFINLLKKYYGVAN